MSIHRKNSGGVVIIVIVLLIAIIIIGLFIAAHDRKTQKIAKEKAEIAQEINNWQAASSKYVNQIIRIDSVLAVQKNRQKISLKERATLEYNKSLHEKNLQIAGDKLRELRNDLKKYE